MARKKKRADLDEHERGAPGEAMKPAPAIGTSLKGLLAGVKLDASPSRPAAKAPAKPASPPKATKRAGAAARAAAPAEPEGASPTFERPSERLRGNDRIAFFDAYAGVRGLDAGKGKPKRLAAPAKPARPIERPDVARDAEARRQLDALVGGAFTFDVDIDEAGFVEGLRRDAPIEALGALRAASPRVDRRVDLHGLRESDVEERLPRLLRDAQASGARRVLVIHGKGLHSPDGVAVLRDAVLRILEASTASPLVLAFSSAPPELGGTGATLVELTKERGRR